MTFLDWPREQSPAGNSFARKKVVLKLLALFGRAFPQIEYDLLWQSPTINAQAWRLGPSWRVSIFGGLARHSTLTRAGLALAIAHETGHHLGGPPRDLASRWMSWQGQADYWAAAVAMPLIFGANSLPFTLRGARQLQKLQEDFESQLTDDTIELSSSCRYAIFEAGALGKDIPACAHAEYARSFRREYLGDGEI